jgi:hypothetical protein
LTTGINDTGGKFATGVDFFGPSKSQDFVPGPFRNLELAAFSDLAG